MAGSKRRVRTHNKGGKRKIRKTARAAEKGPCLILHLSNISFASIVGNTSTPVGSSDPCPRRDNATLSLEFPVN